MFDHKNLTVRVGMISLDSLNSKCIRHSLITFMFDVRNNFIRKRVTTKFSDRRSDLVKGHTCRPYKSTGGHLLFIKSS